METPLYIYIAISIAVVLLLVAIRVMVLYLIKVSKSDTITFIKGNNKITVSKHYNRGDSKKLLHL